jgi:hypothetical protein
MARSPILASVNGITLISALITEWSWNRRQKKRQHASGYVKSVAVREGNRKENEGLGSPDALGRAQ